MRADLRAGDRRGHQSDHRRDRGPQLRGAPRGEGPNETAGARRSALEHRGARGQNLSFARDAGGGQVSIVLTLYKLAALLGAVILPDIETALKIKAAFEALRPEDKTDMQGPTTAPQHP